MIWLFTVAIILLLLGWLLVRRARVIKRETGLPTGRLVYVDAHQNWQPTVKPLYSSIHRLVGKPDYVVETATGLIPVEVKSSAAPSVPYLGHLLQLAAYCLLIEETTGHTPAHGLLKYADALYEVDYTRELRLELLETMADMRRARLTDNIARSHNQAGKCAACGFGYICEEALS